MNRETEILTILSHLLKESYSDLKENYFKRDKENMIYTCKRLIENSDQINEYLIELEVEEDLK